MYFTGGEELRARLYSSVQKYKACGWSEGTKRTYRTQLNCFQTFCELLDLALVPFSADNVCLYIAYLVDVKSFKYCTIVNYLNIIKHLHKANGLEEPISGNWQIQKVLNGVRRSIGDAQKGAELMTPRLLLLIKANLDLNSQNDICIWSACLMGFYGLLRPGNFLHSGKYVEHRDIQICDVHYHRNGYVIELQWTKTVQFRERKLTIVLPSIVGHPLCPASAIKELLHFHFKRGAKEDAPLLCNLSYQMFITRINSILISNDVKQHITGHSFRRGGATWCLRIGMSDSMIKDIGMWKSDAYLRYTEVDLSRKFDIVQSFGASLPPR